MSLVISSIVTIGFVSCTIWFATWVWRRRHLYAVGKKLPGPFAFPILGNAYMFLCSQKDMFKVIRKLFTEYPDIFRIWIGPKLVIMVKDAGLIGKILQSPTMIQKDDLMDVTRPFLGDGLLVGSGPKWRKHRRAITHELTARAVSRFAPAFARHARVLTEKLRAPAARGDTVVINDYLHYCSFDIVGETFVDVDLKSQHLSERSVLVDRVVDVYGHMFRKMTQPWLLLVDRVFNFFGVRNMEYELADDLNVIVREAIDKIKDTQQSEIMNDIIDRNCNRNKATDETSKTNLNQNGGGHKMAANQNGGSYKDDLDDSFDVKDVRSSSTLENLIRSDLEISDEDLVYEMNNLFFASSDTVASISCFTIRMLAIYPKYQDLAVKEVLSLTDGDDGLLTSDDCSRMAYLERCIKDAIRLFPIGPMMVRACNEYFVLNEDITIPPGATVLMAPFHVHRAPEHWSHPEEFHPDHFLPEAAAIRHQFAYMAFSHGLRSCVGKVFAITSIKALVASLLLRYKFSCTPGDTVRDMDLSSDISIREIGGSRIKVELRPL